MKIYFRLYEYLKPYWLEIIGAIVSLFVVSACNIAIIPIVGKFSQSIETKNFLLLNLAIIAAIIAYFIQGLFNYAQVYLMSFAGQRVVVDLRIHVYKHLQDLSFDFFAKWRTGDMISRIWGDIDMLRDSTINTVTEFLPGIITFISVLFYLFYLNWRLTIITIIVLPLLAITLAKFGEQMREIAREARIKAADVITLLNETISGVRLVKSFTMEQHEIKRFTKESEKVFFLQMKETQIGATQKPILSFLQVLAMVVVVWWGGYEVVKGTLSASNLVAFFAGIALIAQPVSTFSKISMTLQKTISTTERVFEVIDMVPTVKEKPNATTLPKISGKVEFKNVSFHYEKEEGDVLKDLNIKVSPGKIIALVGPSGAGKSTFVNLIPRFYDPYMGQIEIDGQDIKDVTLFSLRRQIGIVPQETILFSGTIRDNISYGEVDATENEIIEAAKTANAHDFIMAFPDGYDTKVGERGVRLSGGERQRIAIARAVLRNPRILILDEATSSLDMESERIVQTAMDRLMTGRTTFVIAHRLSTIQHADEILVIDDGKIIEQGSHSELLKKGGIYKKLYEMQFRDKEAKKA